MSELEKHKRYGMGAHGGIWGPASLAPGLLRRLRSRGGRRPLKRRRRSRQPGWHRALCTRKELVVSSCAGLTTGLGWGRTALHCAAPRCTAPVPRCSVLGCSVLAGRPPCFLSLPKPVTGGGWKGGEGWGRERERGEKKKKACGCSCVVEAVENLPRLLSVSLHARLCLSLCNSRTRTRTTLHRTAPQPAPALDPLRLTGAPPTQKLRSPAPRMTPSGCLMPPSA